MKIAVVTTTRAEYGVMKNLLKEIINDDGCELSLIVSGTHLIKEYGYTVKYIEEDGFKINHRVFVKIDDSSPLNISLTMSNYMIAFSKLFADNHFDILVVIGDRYELIPICSAAMIEKIPIAHISGGEITEGAIDDCIRHCVTKMSYLHFPACEEYRKRIIQLGESPNRVFNVGDPGVENIYKMKDISKNELFRRLGLSPIDDYFVVVFHPTTLDNISPEKQVSILLDALAKFNNVGFIFIKSNADFGGSLINQKIESFVNCKECCHIFTSLKIEEYLMLQKYSLGLVGNSSSGIIETPCFNIPTLNIGNRQRGRLMADSILSVDLNSEEIIKGIKKCMSKDFRKSLKNVKNPYGNSNTSEAIVKIIKNEFSKGIDLMKKFYDLEAIK